MSGEDDDDDQGGGPPEALKRIERLSRMMQPPKFIRDIDRLNKMLTPLFLRDMERLHEQVVPPAVFREAERIARLHLPPSPLSDIVGAANPMADAVRAANVLGGIGNVLDGASAAGKLTELFKMPHLAALQPLGALHRTLLGIHAGIITPEFETLAETEEDETLVLTPEEVFDRWNLPSGKNEILLQAGTVPLAVMQELMRQPEAFFKLDHRQFEWVVAEILARRGFKNILLTPRSDDGGKDVIATYHAAGIPVVFYFECKHHREGYPVDMGDLRALMGVVNSRDSTAVKGVLATTGRFTEGGRKYIASEAQLDGKDYQDLVGWVRKLRLE